MGARIAGFLLAVSSAFLLALSVMSMIGEASPYLRAGLPIELRFAGVAGGEYRPALSFRSKDDFFKDCLEVGLSLYAEAQPSRRRVDFFGACDASAGEALGQMPTYSRAWLVKAAASASQKSFEALNSALLSSRQTAPNVTYLADWRVWLAMRNFSHLDDQEVAALEADLRVLLTVPRGVEVVGYHYVNEPSQRERITLPH